MRAKIRRIRADEWPRLREMRLQALAEAPLAFGSTRSREEAFLESVWRARAADGAAGADRVIFIAEQEEQWIGLATGLGPYSEGPQQLYPMLVGMFVVPSARQRGTGTALVQNVIRWDQDSGAIRLSLWVNSSNEAAVALWLSSFFCTISVDMRSGEMRALQRAADFRAVPRRFPWRWPRRFRQRPGKLFQFLPNRARSVDQFGYTHLLGRRPGSTRAPL